MALRPGLSAAAGLRILIFLLALFRLTSGYQYVPGSRCESKCQEGDLDDDATCLDAEYRSKPGGRRIESCVSCLLNSTAVDTTTNVTDVEWGLYSLRYTLSSCMFGVPEERVSISSPCQVTCAPLNASIGHHLTNDSSKGDPSTGFCTSNQFDDTTINNCAFCYSFIPQQLFTANFLQALHIQCRDPPANGEPFFPDGPTIFNETLIAGPAAPSNGTGSGGGLHGTGLALAIALPVVGGIFIFGFGCWGCFVLTRNRRRRMAASGRMSRVQEKQAEGGGSMYSPIEGKMMWGANEPPREMHQFTPHLTPNARQPSPNVAQRWSQHYPPGTAIGDDGTPLRNSFQRDDVGPGEGQLQDPNLHEQYFGIADGGEDERQDHSAGLGLYQNGDYSETHTPQLREPQPPHQQPHGSGGIREDERGHWVQ